MNLRWGNQHHLDYGSASREAREERDFRDAVDVEVSKTCHIIGNHIAQIFVFYMPVGPINAVPRGS